MVGVEERRVNSKPEIQNIVMLCTASPWAAVPMETAVVVQGSQCLIFLSFTSYTEIQVTSTLTPLVLTQKAMQ